MTRLLMEEQRFEGTELQLWQNWIAGKKEWELVVNGVFIMATYNSLSSELLVRLGLEKISGPSPWKVLIGGLGMGFSVREACRNQGVAQVDVVEIEPAVVAWNQDHLAESNGDCLKAAPVSVITDDFYDYIMAATGEYDLVAMDIDNGPMMLARKGNSRVYGRRFFARIKALLRPGGVFTIWSGNPAPELQSLGREVFSACEQETVYETHQGQEAAYYLYFMSNR